MTDASASFQDLLGYTQAALRQADWARACDLAEQLRTHFPDRVEGFLLGANALEGAGDADGAETLLDETPKGLRGSRVVEIEYAWLAHRRKEWEEATRRWKSVRDRFPDQPTPYIALGLVARACANYKEADLALSRAIALFPDNPAAWIEYAWTALQRRDFVEARQRWQEVRDRFSDQPTGYLGGGVTERDAGAFGSAAELLLAGERRFPGNRSIVTALAWLATHRGDHREALARWKALALCCPGDPSIAEGLRKAREAMPRHFPADEFQATDCRARFIWHRKTLTMLSGDSPPGMAREVLTPAASWERSPPAFVADLSGDLPNHGLTGANLKRSAQFRSTIERCSVFGTHHFHAVLQEGGEFSSHYTSPDVMRRQIEYYISHHVTQSRLSPYIEATDDGFVCSSDHLDATEMMPLGGSIFFSSPGEPDNFGMWLVTALPRAHDFVNRRQEDKLLCWIRFNWQRQLLAYIGVRDDQIVVQDPHRVYVCERLTMHQHTDGSLALAPRDLMLFAELRERYRDTTAFAPERIFVSRRALTKRMGYRALLNEDSLAAALQNRGFIVVEPETLDFPTQVSLFAQARTVVGVGGAGMFNAVFCAPGAKIVSIESSLAFSHQHANLFASAQLDYAFIFGQQDMADPAPVHKRWTVDVDAAMDYIDLFI